MMTEIKFKMKVALQKYYVLGISSVPYLVIINYTCQDYRRIMGDHSFGAPNKHKVTLTNSAGLFDFLYCG